MDGHTKFLIFTCGKATECSGQWVVKCHLEEGEDWKILLMVGEDWCKFVLPAAKPRRSMGHSYTIGGMEEEMEYFLMTFCELKHSEGSEARGNWKYK